jgi:hypothetical protein
MTRIRQTRSVDFRIIVNDGMVSWRSRKTVNKRNKAWFQRFVDKLGRVYTQLSFGDFRSSSPRLRKKTNGV